MPSMPGASTFSTSIECSGDVELVVVAPYTTDLDHVVTYTWNGGWVCEQRWHVWQSLVHACMHYDTAWAQAQLFANTSLHMQMFILA